MEKATEKAMPEGYILAPTLLRVAAAALDLSFFVALLIALYFAAFQNIGSAVGLYDRQDQLISYRLAAGLMIEKDGVVEDVSGSNYEDYKAAVETYYFVYNALTNSDNPHPEGYTVSFYNQNVLGLPDGVDKINNSALFEWAKGSDEKPDPTKIGVIKASLYVDGALTADAKANLLTFYQGAINQAIALLSAEPYYASIASEVQGQSLGLLSLITFVAAFAVYAIPPLCNSSRATLGKLIMKLRLVAIKGEPLPWWRALLRNIPLFLTLLVALLLDNVVSSLAVILAVFLITLSLGLLTPRRQAAHDYLVMSVVARKELPGA